MTTTMHAFVPHGVRWCPAFAACFAAIGASASALDLPHANYSWLMSWGAA